MPSDKKITQLPAAVTLVDADIFPVVDAGTTTNKKTTLAQLKAATAALGSNLGTALEIFKDVVSGTVRHRTLRVFGNKSAEQDPSGYSGELHIRPSPPGHYNPHDFGAAGDGVTDDSAAFEAMLAAMGSAAVVYGAGYSATAILADNMVYYLAENLILDRSLSIIGCGGQAYNAAMASKLKFAPGKGVWMKGFSGYDRPAGNGATLKRVALEFQAVPGVGEYAHSTAYAVGDLINIPTDREFIYECVEAGTTSARPEAEWLPSTAYTAGDLVTPPTPNGHVYRCTTGGTTDSTEPVNWWFWPGAEVEDGSVTWTEDYGTNPCYLDSWADVALRPHTAITDDAVLWNPGQVYEYNQVVRVVGITASVFWLGSQLGVPVSGTSGVTPPTAGTAGTTVSDGLLEWTRYDGAGAYMETDGTATFMPRLHCGVEINCTGYLEDVQINGATCYAVHIMANGGGRPAYNADFWQLTRVTGSNSNHGFIRARGQDGQAGMAIGCTGFGNYDGVHFREWDRGYVDLSQAGNTWIGCNSQENTGYSFQAGGEGCPTFVGCYSESICPSKLLVAAVVGGNLSNLPITEDSRAVMLRGQRTYGLRCADDKYSTTTGTIDAYLAGQKYAALAGRCSFAVRAGDELDAQGLTWSNTLSSWPDGWHVWTFAPGIYGGLFATFGVSGDTATALRDNAPYVTGQYLLTKGNGFHVNGIPGDTTGSANFVGWRAALPTTGKWLKGDIIYNTLPASAGYVGWTCTVEGDFAGTPPTFKTFGLIT